MATKKKATKKAVKKASKKPAKKAAIRQGAELLPGKFYTFRQNNSFGEFDYNEKKGISVNVIVEADSYEDANIRAERIGLYFDGSGDCPCCGNRWSPQYEWNGKDDGSDVPSVYGNPVGKGFTMMKAGDTKWMKQGQAEGYIHYKDGTIVSFWLRA